ncbi:4Fe-4S ferredoxin iron-sulfur binding domain protein [Desulfobulbus propionicus DSM 2032]|jgi:NAD-dependent dihydropyrimidine dehydrogenase PreA subunit|uniref:4Fe-4S ferredoxin iron-sulfur binding domain protein n=1 Tax=Desulfobulbus propionicus (strain ATCC 33891 / DSM 2032 / VKM B-1956 / 1pr3) TaxID=577650 RepID=A0A7U3YJN4_DESPD|nr:mercury methylation ferredoxin HgcB [Desulfobulbus propionicus]ADW16619.1 4Fe-4S ferredoxin iron-sulfur binding domain protein [Desulfobulbus propionicus DSM 2032]
MHGYRYIDDTATLEVDFDRCIGCGNCTVVCPHRIFALEGEKLKVGDRDLCMECGACARNCPVQALTVTPGVGCAVAILAAWINRLLGRKLLSGCC